MHSFTGKICPIYEGVDEVSPIDLVVQLGRTGRFARRGNLEWSVLHHVNLCTFLWLKLGWEQKDVIYMLLHDYHEAYTSDIPTPVKRQTEDRGKGIEDLQDRIDRKIRASLNLPDPDEETLQKIYLVDRMALIIEGIFFGPKGYNTFHPQEGMSDQDARKYLAYLKIAIPEHYEEMHAAYLEAGRPPLLHTATGP
jgi:hypothetical protein